MLRILGPLGLFEADEGGVGMNAVRILALLAILTLPVCAADSGDGDTIEKIDDSELSLSERLGSISLDMFHYHDDLRDDRHDKNTQAQGEEIRKRLQKIIDDAEDGGGGGSAKKNKNGGNQGMKDSKLTGYDDNGERIPGVSRVWSRDIREETVDSHVDLAKPIVGRDGRIEGRWEMRIRAYFYSLAVAQAEYEKSLWDKKPKKK